MQSAMVIKQDERMLYVPRYLGSGRREAVTLPVLLPKGVNSIISLFFLLQRTRANHETKAKSDGIAEGSK